MCIDTISLPDVRITIWRCIDIYHFDTSHQRKPQGYTLGTGIYYDTVWLENLTVNLI